MRLLSSVITSAVVAGALVGAGVVRAEPPAAASRQMGTLVLRVGVEGATVDLDGREVGRTPLPGPWLVPAGRHRVVVRPPDGAPASAEFEVAAGGTATVELLGREVGHPAPSVEAPVRVVHTGPGFSVANAGYVTAGLGLASLAAGTFFLLDARSTADDAAALDRTDPRNRRADLEALVDDVDRADFFGRVLVGVGAAALLGGAAMVLLASDGPFSVGGTVVAPAPGGAVIGGRF